MAETDPHKIYYRRFDWVFVVQHVILLVCVLALIVSGVPLKFPEAHWAKLTIRLQGGMDARRIIHHTAGLTLVALGVFHFLYYYLFNWRTPFYRRGLMPRPSDLMLIARHMGYIVGLRRDIPPMGRYTWFEKLDYIGLIWGILVMGVTGMSMLFMEVALQFIPMAWLQVLWAAHSEEAMLATLFLLVVHMYNVHFNPEKFPLSLTFLTGWISHHEMEKYHALELEQWKEHGLLDELRVPEASHDPAQGTQTDRATQEP